MDIEAWLVCEKNKLTVSTLVSIFVGHGGWAPRTWTDSLLASDNGSTNGLQHFVLINLSQGFWTLSSSKRRKQAFPSPRHPTPPHQKTNLSHCSRYHYKQQNMFWLRGGWKGSRLFCFSSFTLFDNSTSVWSWQLLLYDSLYVLSCSLKRDSAHLYDGYDDTK